MYRDMRRNGAKDFSIWIQRMEKHSKRNYSRFRSSKYGYKEWYNIATRIIRNVCKFSMPLKEGRCFHPVCSLNKQTTQRKRWRDINVGNIWIKRLSMPSCGSPNV